MQKHQIEELTCKVCGLVKATAAFISEQAGKVAAPQIEEKFKNGLVSYVDKEAETRLVNGLGAMLPEAVFWTEEDTVKNQEGDYQWIIDPLDGTTNFLYNIPHYSISVALYAHGEPVIGVVHHVPQNEQFYAWKGGGAYMNGQAINCTPRATLGDCVVATGFPYHDHSRVKAWGKAYHYFLGNARGVRRFGSAALDLAWVAAGRFDVFFEYGLNPWDVAAGALIVQEAGGTVTDFSGKNDFLHGGEILASTTSIHPKVLDVVLGCFL